MGSAELNRSNTFSNQKQGIVSPRSHSDNRTSLIADKLHKIGELVGKGFLVTSAIRQIGIAESTYYRWRAILKDSESSNLLKQSSDNHSKLQALEAENRRLKLAVADLILEQQILKEKALDNNTFIL